MSEETDDSPNGLNQDKLVSRLQAVLDVARKEGDISAIETIGALEVVKLGIYQDLVDDEI